MSIVTPTPIAIKHKLNTQLVWGFTLVELMVSAILMALILVGVGSLFVIGKRNVLHSRGRISAGELGKLFLDPLQMEVREDQWGNNCLSSQQTAGCPGQLSVGGITYTPIYTIDDVSGTTLRRVKLTVNWQEPLPLLP